MTFARKDSRYACRLLVAALLVTEGALGLGCGQATDEVLDPAVTLLAQVVPQQKDPTAPPEGVAACQRRALCVPENPCHLGQVTGCRANVPICTDTGAWLPNGAECGEDCVCFRGTPTFCDAGAACHPLDPWGQPDRCQAGTTVCTTGRPVCSPLGLEPDGTACSDGAPMVCKGGVCTWCLDGEACTLPDQPCLQGTVQGCSTGGTCVAGAPQPPGTWCPGGVCLDGGCNACEWGAPCDTGNPCLYGYVDCSAGAPACLVGGYANGAPCDGGVCQWGACVAPCVPGEPCTVEGNACATGQRRCEWSWSWCEQTGTAPNGTACGDQQVCSAGSCTPCGTACPSTDSCAPPATLSCLTGLCEPSGSPAADGTTCGPAGEECNAGACKGTAGNPLLVRAASGAALPLADTSWADCSWSEEHPGMSRRAVFGFGATTFSFAEIIFPFSLDCSGPAAASLSGAGSASALTDGDRFVGWDPGAPAGLPATVTATATSITGVDFSVKFLFFVDDREAPGVLYMGEGKGAPTAPDGYPLRLGAGNARPRVACAAGGACQGMGGTCRTWTLGCDYLAEACLETGVAPDTTQCGVGGERCVAGGCLGAPGAPLVVRTTAGGQVDLTGLTFAACMPGEPEPWLSRRRADTFLPGGTLHAEEVFWSLDCSGAPDPAESWSGELTIVLGGDRFAAWRGTVPWGAPPTLWTTGVIVSGTTPGGPFTGKDLVVVDVDSAPWRLYTGEDDNPTLLDAEGFPAFMLDGAILRQ